MLRFIALFGMGIMVFCGAILISVLREIAKMNPDMP